MLPLDPTQPIPIRAVNLSDRLDTRPLRGPGALSLDPLTLPVEGGGLAVLFRFGVAVFFGVSPESETRFLQTLTPHLIVPAQTPDREDTVLRVRPDALVEGSERDGLVVRELTLERVLVAASVLGKSVALAALESRVAHAFEHVEPLASALGREGKLTDDQHVLFRQIGRALLIEHAMVSRVEVNEKPDVLWEQPGLEGFYLRLASEYELADRAGILDRRVELLSRTSSTVLGLAQQRASMRMEWCILGLFVFEVVLTLGAMAGLWR
jgi:uncharacterized Rmd1/YagE family protein